MPGNTKPSVAAAERPAQRGRLPLPLPLGNQLPRLLPELGLLLLVNAGYKYGRKLANGQTGPAFRHARDIWSFERDLRLPGEHTVQRAMMHWEPVIHAANYLYATVHFPAMVCFLGYMFLRHRAHYLWIRRAIVIQTLLALLGHLFYPLAPPRMLPGSGMVDTAARYGPAVYGEPDGQSMSNQFAAMPSLHVGWALAIAVGLIAAHRSRLRWLWLLHPLVTLLVVVGTANHYWLDCVIGCALLGIAVLIIPGPAPETALRPDTHWAWPLKRGPRRPAAASSPPDPVAARRSVAARGSAVGAGHTTVAAERAPAGEPAPAADPP